MNYSLKKLLQLFVAGSLLILATLWLTACSDDEPSIPPTIKLAENATLGKILTDDQGRTLYFYSRDSKGSPSACTGGCLNKWPIFNTEKIALPAGLLPEDFGSIGDGATKQVTYKGWPLYYYAPASDGVIEEVGATGGDKAGNVWYVAKPDYSLMIANAQLIGSDGKNYLGTNYAEGTGATSYFTDAKGRTIYIFTTDKKNTNNWTSAGLTNNTTWPIFYVPLEKLPSGINPDDFGKIRVQGAADQLTYKGWPLYYYWEDTARGDNKGVSVPNPGKWPVVNSSTPDAPII